VSEPRTSPLSTGETDGDELFFPASGFCFGCSRDNPAGLHLRFFRDGDGVRCDSTLGRTHQGATDIVHGGIQAVLLDEASCAATYFTRGSYVVTGGLNVRYHRPCPTGRPLHVRALVVEDTGRYFVVRAEIRVAGDDEVVTSSEGRFYRDARRNVP
jgi:uncharacterized protein (TIGR00369 family)